MSYNYIKSYFLEFKHLTKNNFKTVRTFQNNKCHLIKSPCKYLYYITLITVLVPSKVYIIRISFISNYSKY